MSEQKFNDLPSGNVSPLAWELAQFDASDRGTLMRDAICRPDYGVDELTDNIVINICFHDYWHELFGVDAPHSALAFYVGLLSTPETRRHFRRLNESLTNEQIEAALRRLVIHLFEGVRDLKHFPTN